MSVLCSIFFKFSILFEARWYEMVVWHCSYDGSVEIHEAKVQRSVAGQVIPCDTEERDASMVSVDCASDRPPGPPSTRGSVFVCGCPFLPYHQE